MSLKTSVKSSKRAVKSRRQSSDWVACEKQYAKIFGPSLPKGKWLNADGECVAPLATAREGIYVRQSAPQHNDIGWLYVSHGLSRTCVKAFGQKQRIELLVHWKERNAKAPVCVLTRLARHILANNSDALVSNRIITTDKILDLVDSGFNHWLICSPDKNIPAFITNADSDKVNFLLLLGISDGELRSALRVKPEIADGCKVLLEALKIGGIFPLSDPARLCLTRRRNFNRLWERAFHIVREQI